MDVVVSGESPALFAQPKPRIVVSMRDHALRRMVAAVMRVDSDLDVIETFGEPDLFAEMSRAPVESIVIDARRDPIGALDTLSSIRERSRIPVVLVVMSKPDDAFVDAASRLGGSLLRIPVTTSALKAAVTPVTRP